MATIKMLANISGTRNGVEWPELGGTIDVPADEAESLAAAGLARVIDEPKVERAGLARRGLADRVAQVDAELMRIGAEVPREAKPEPLRTAARNPRVTRG